MNFNISVEIEYFILSRNKSKKTLFFCFKLYSILNEGWTQRDLLKIDCLNKKKKTTHFVLYIETCVL